MKDSAENELELRVARLEARLSGIEQQLGIGEKTSEAPARVEMVEPVPAPVEPLVSHLLHRKYGVEPPSDPVAAGNEERDEFAGEGAGFESPPAIDYSVVPPPLPTAQGQLERTIGLKWAGWVGAVLLMIGASFGVKYVYDHHWFGRVPPEVWLGAIFAGGLGLIGVGEVIYRRVHVIPAASAFGAGVATLFLAGYVGHIYYRLYSPSTALTLMAAAAIIGALVAMRGNLVSIGVLSIIGGNVAPLLVGDQSAPLGRFLIYLLALQAVALTLAWWGRGRKWWILRSLSLGTTALWIANVTIGYTENEQLVLTYCSLYAALFHAELILSAFHRRDQQHATSHGGGGVAFALLVTCAFTLVVLRATHDFTDHQRGAIIVGISVIFAILGWVLSRLGKAKEGSALSALGVSHRVASAALLALAVSIAFHGLSAEVGWALLAVAFAVVGRVTKSPIARWSGPIAWGLALAHLYMTAQPDSGLYRGHGIVWLTVWGQQLTSQMFFAWGLAIVGQVIAILVAKPRSDGETASVARAVSVVASVLCAVTSVLSLPPLGATACVIGYVWALVGSDFVAPELGFSLQAGALLLIAVAKWALVDMLTDRLSPGWSAMAYRPVLNLQVLVAIIVAGSLMVGRWLAAGLDSGSVSIRQLQSQAGFFAVFVLTWAGTFEIDRAVEQMQIARTLSWPLWQAKLLAWTIGWMFATCGTFVVLRRRDENAEPSALWPRILPRIIGVLTFQYLTIDVIPWRIFGPPAVVPLLGNLETACAATVMAALVMIYVMGLPAAFRSHEERMRRQAGFAATLVLLWAGSIEIDRFFAAASPFANTALAEQVALSIFWSTFAVGCVVIGFRLSAAGLRYFGLGLFAVTLLKVVFIDMSQVETGYRVLSFMALGALLMGTSVLYGKLGPRLLHDE